MLQRTDDLRIANLRPLIPPAVLVEEELPITEKASETVTRARQEAAAIVTGQDDRLLAIVGPCSIHDTEAAIEYAGPVVQVRRSPQRRPVRHHASLFRETPHHGGLEGPHQRSEPQRQLRYQPGAAQSPAPAARPRQHGRAAGSEFLDTISPQFIADLISWGAIGARTTESQVHRELASGLSMPVGFKNGTDGNIQIAIDAMGAAQRPHHFLGVSKQGVAAIVETGGNNNCHVILRGSNAGTNFDRENVESVAEKLDAVGLAGRVMVDCSHGNSRKKHANQPAVVESLAEQVGSGSARVFGVMMESHLVEGNQPLGDDVQALTYGQSITDACMSWDTTEPMLELLAQASRQRRQKK